MTVINRLNEIKVNRHELFKTNDVIDNLNDRVKHISVLQNQLAEMLVPVRDSIGHFDPKKKKEILTKVGKL